MASRFAPASYRQAAIVVSIIAVVGVAQPAQVDREAIQVSTHLVQINVIVRDKNGPVTGLTKDDFVRILKEPKNSLTRQYTALLATETVTLEFTDNAIDKRIPTPVITTSLYERFSSRGQNAFAAKVNAALRNQFGGHALKVVDTAAQRQPHAE